MKKEYITKFEPEISKKDYKRLDGLNRVTIKEAQEVLIGTTDVETPYRTYEGIKRSFDGSHYATFLTDSSDKDILIDIAKENHIILEDIICSNTNFHYLGVELKSI